MSGSSLCDHCLLPVTPQEIVRATVSGADRLFCCTGCMLVFRIIHEEGLEDFYRRRTADAEGIPVGETPRIDPLAFTDHVRDIDDGCELDLVIDGIHCASCVWLNERILKHTEGISQARVNYATHVARIRWNPGQIELADILDRIQNIGYRPKPYELTEQAEARRLEERDLLVRFGTAAFLSSQLMIYSTALYAGYFQGMEPRLKLLLELIAMVLTLPVLLYSGMPFYRAAKRGLAARTFNMDFLIALGATSAFIYSLWQMGRGGEVYFDTAAMIVTLVLLGRYIEAVAKTRASRAIHRLAELLPVRATVIDSPEAPSDGGVRVRLRSILPGTLVRVTPGERIPLDGVVADGSSEVDESLLSGEPKPVAKEAGSEVVGGSVNLYGSLVVRVTKSAAEGVVARIIEAVEDAQAHKPRIQRIADRIVAVFVPIILVLATATVIGHLLRPAPISEAMMTGVSVLVIACPCSLGLATPLAVLMFTSAAAGRGLMIRSGEILEALPQVTDAVFDKTGTVTLGRPVLRQIIAADRSLAENLLLALAAAIEERSEHTLGRAIVERGRHLLPELGSMSVSNFEAVPGRGISAQIDGCSVADLSGPAKISIGNRGFLRRRGIDLDETAALFERVREAEQEGHTAVFIGWRGCLRGAFLIAVAMREDAPGVVSELAEWTETTLLSGDNRATTEAVARRLRFDHVISEATPVEKGEKVRALQKMGRKVLMVGDGINDAPALTAAAVGLAVGRGTDIAMESADAVLARDDLTLLPLVMRLARRCRTIIRQNLFWAFFYNVVAIPLAVAGILHPIVAAAAMAASSLIVVLNSLRVGGREIPGKRGANSQPVAAS